MTPRANCYTDACSFHEHMGLCLPVSRPCLTRQTLFGPLWTWGKWTTAGQSALVQLRQRAGWGESGCHVPSAYGCIPCGDRRISPELRADGSPAWGSIITVSGSLFCVSACSLSHTRTHTLTRTRSCQVRGVSTCRWPGDAAVAGVCVSPDPAAMSACLLPTSRPGPVASARNHLRLFRGSRGGLPSACSGAATRGGAREDKAALGSGGRDCTEPKAPGFKKVSALRSLPKMGCQRGCFSDEQIGNLRQGTGTEQQKALAILVGSFWGRDSIFLILGLSSQNTWGTLWGWAWLLGGLSLAQASPLNACSLVQSAWAWRGSSGCRMSCLVGEGLAPTLGLSIGHRLSVSPN